MVNYKDYTEMHGQQNIKKKNTAVYVMVSRVSPIMLVLSLMMANEPYMLDHIYISYLCFSIRCTRLRDLRLRPPCS